MNALMLPFRGIGNMLKILLRPFAAVGKLILTPFKAFAPVLADMGKFLFGGIGKSLLGVGGVIVRGLGIALRLMPGDLIDNLVAADVIAGEFRQGRIDAAQAFCASVQWREGTGSRLDDLTAVLVSVTAPNAQEAGQRLFCIGLPEAAAVMGFSLPA